MSLDYTALYCRHYSLLAPRGSGARGPAPPEAERPAIVRFDDHRVISGPGVEDLGALADSERRRSTS